MAMFDDLIPQGRAPASVRNNNPGAQWPGQSATRFGSTAYETLNDGQGNRIARFDTPEQGAAAQFDLLNRVYAGLPLNQAIRKWSGGNSSDAYAASVAQAMGMQPTDVLSPDILADPQRAIPFAKAMARIEAGRDFPMSDDQWMRGYQMYSGAPQLAPGVAAIDAAVSPAQPLQNAGPFEDLIPQGRAPTGRPTFDVNLGPGPASAQGSSPPVNAAGGVSAQFGAFDGMTVDPSLHQRGEDIAQIGERYGLTDPQEILRADRRAQGVQDYGIANNVAQGASVNLSDEAKALYGSITGAGSYNENLAAEREGLRRFERDNPITAAAAQVGGALAVAPFLPVANVARGAGVLGRVASGALTGAGYGAAYGFGGGEGGLGERARDASTGGVVGGGIGAAAPAAFSILGAAGRGVNAVAGNPIGVVRGLVNPEAEATRRVGTAIARDTGGGSPQQALTSAANALDAQGAPAVLADMGGETTRAVARSAANTSPEGRSAIQSVTQNRFETQGQRVTDEVSALMGGRGNNVQRVEQLRADARAANRPLYERAYREADGGIWTPDLEALVQAPAVQDAIRAATKRGANRAVIEGVGPIRNPFVTDDAGNLVLAADEQGNRALPNLRFWDVVKRNLDSSIDTAKRGGDKTYAADLTDLKNQLLQTLDSASKTYSKARATAASAFGAEDALEAGEKFVTSTMRNDEARAALARMKPAERELFAEGFATGLVNKVGEVRDRVNVVNQIFGSAAARERIQMALGPKRTEVLEAFVRRENVMDMLRQALGNSTTARQLQELGLAGGAGLLASGGNPTDPKGLLVAAAVYGGRRGAARVDERVARRVADLLVSDNPETVRRAVQGIAGSGALSRALRAIEGNLAKLIAPAGANGNIAPSLPAPGRAEDN